jgi:uncharacterized membrane protein YqjE
MTPHAARDPAPPDGLFDTLKGMAAVAVDVAQTRLELLSLEVEEERARLSALLVLSLVALFFLGLAIIFAALLVVTVWPHPVWVFGTLALLFLVGGLVAALRALRQIKAKPRLFQTSVSELEKDRAHLLSSH